MQQIDITVAEALHARDPATHMVDPDLGPPVGGILAASPSGNVGAMVTMPVTRCACSAANSSAQGKPLQNAASNARSVPVASSTAAMSPAKAVSA